MYELTVIVEFEAAHRIVDYPGNCDRLHGHNWSVEVTVEGEKLNKLGMLIDFKELKGEVNKVIDLLDHHYLNELPSFKEINPTAENIAKFIFEKMTEADFINDNITISMVKIWETPKSAVCYRG